ncbi:MAG: ion transporter [Paludibacteraceae bacterium]|nr:ion transporter [Paludibacteraceae bacterium]
MNKIQIFKQELARVFDDNLRTKQWQNYVDYAIIGLIILSTVEVFLSTYDGIVERYGIWLKVVDYFTTAFFTIEVSLRIWCADLIDDKYKGIWGRVRYCFSFYGLIDILSTYPFYLHFFMPMPYVALKALRIARLLRVFRYMKAFNVLSRAMRAKKDEMWVSVQFLTIVTLILSFVLFFVEHEAQPEVYNNGWTSVLWAFAQYIGDPGNFADTPPITITGRVIACIIGVLGIAIFAVPAGLIGSAFSEVMEKDERKEKAEGWAERLHLAFERKLDRPTGFQIVPRYVSVVEIQARLGLKEDEILDAVAISDKFRLINLSSTATQEEQVTDLLAVEHFPVNTIYGQYIDRHSKVTIFSPSNIVDPIIGWWAYYLAKIGGFNYISREVGETRPYASFYTYKDDNIPGRQECMADFNRLVDNEEKWVFTILAASGGSEPAYPTQFHFTYGAKKGDETYDDPNITLNDIPAFDALYKEFASLLETQYSLSADRQRYHTNANAGYFARHLEHKVNAVALRVAWSVTARDTRAIQIAQTLAQTINRNINHTDNPDVPELKVKAIGYEGYNN